jgi:glyoxylase-like metal-dependent hydrolase (beta-lactamase superfamily II)
MEEHVVFHRPSRTLIVADLLFNFGSNVSAWTRFLVLCAVGTKHHPGMSRPFRMAIKDKAAFGRSVRALMQWDFDRIIVGHGEIVRTDGKRQLGEALKRAGFLG